MINDGGAERMVRDRKITWWQILAVAIMMLFLVLIGAFFYFTLYPQKMVALIEKKTLKNGYELLREIKNEFPEIAVTGYEETKDTVQIQFKYYDDVLTNNTNQIELSMKVKKQAEEYLKQHPDQLFVKKQYEIGLEFPEITYSNKESISEGTFSSCTYHHVEMKPEEFAENIKYLSGISKFYIEKEGLSEEDLGIVLKMAEKEKMETVCLE